MAIREQRFITVGNKIITRTDVQKLAKVVSSNIKKKKDELYNLGVALRFSVMCDDGSSFSSQELDLFGEDSPINSKKVDNITMYYHDVSSGKLIDIKISHTTLENKHYNSITVEGNDSNWVNGTLKKFEEIVDSFAPQNMLMRKRGKLIGSAILIVATFFAKGLIDRLIISLFPNFELFGVKSIKFESFLIQFLAYMVIGAIWYVPIGQLWWKIMDLYPFVEIQIAPEHKLVEKRRRALLTNIVVIVLIPIVLQIIFQLAK